MPSRLFALCNLLGPPSLNRFLRLFPIIYKCSLPEILVTKGVTKWTFNPNSRKFYCLTFTGICFNPIFFHPLPQGVEILLQIFYVFFIQSSAKSLILESVFLQISFTYTRVRPFVHWYSYRFFGRVLLFPCSEFKTPKGRKIWGNGNGSSKPFRQFCNFMSNCMVS